MLQPRAVPLLITFSVVIFVAYLMTDYFPRVTRHYSSKVFQTQNQSLAYAIANSTLGFERVFAIGLPERSDKRDALALTSSLTGFGLTWVDGVRGETIPDKAVPYGTDRVALWENNLGSWRGHMNAVRRVIEDGYSSVLIMEDDMDWDVRLKSQLQVFAEGARFVQSTSFSSSQAAAAPISPYGDDWDLLWLGHCGEIFPETLPENQSPTSEDSNVVPSPPPKFTIYPDPTLPPPERTTGFQNFTQFPQTRWVHVTGGPICTFAYALSASGARKVLYDLSVDHLLGPFDNALANLCRYGGNSTEAGGLGMRCISATPPLFFHHKAKGYIGGDSDIQKVGSAEDGMKKSKGEVREKGFTENIAWSARANIRNLMLGLQPESQFEE